MALLIALAVVAVLYRDTFASIAEKWFDDSAFSHGLLIVPVSLWLAWRKRAELASVEWVPSWLGVLAIGVSVLVWVVARGTSVLVVEQFAAVAMIPAMVLAILGVRVVLLLAFPLAFLFFAVPFGRGLIPVFMQITADIATWALKATGVPIYRSYMYISIPSGQFEVARACSGLNYVITGLVLGTLYGYLTYRGWVKRLVCLFAFLTIPIIANGLRVFVIITIAHLTEMRWGGGPEHVTFGKIFFVLVMLVCFFVGRRWQDPEAILPAAQPVGSVRMGPPITWLPAPLAVLVAMIGPLSLALAMDASARNSDGSRIAVGLPGGDDAWQGPKRDPTAWRPLYKGALTEESASYEEHVGGHIDVYVAVYGLGSTAGSEMISFGNRIFPAEAESLAPETVKSVALGQFGEVKVRQLAVRSERGEQLVWYWFMVGDIPVLSPFAVKGLEAFAFLKRDGVSERIVALSTPLDDPEQASRRLHGFAAHYAACVHAGFAPPECAK